jgi:carbon-monoxide dehydrogenase medium subunit
VAGWVKKCDEGCGGPARPSRDLEERMPQSYEYHRPHDLVEACRLLAELPEAHVLAGGTDLLFDIDAEVRRAQHVISVQDLADLRQIRATGEGLSIGAACTARDVQDSELVREHFPELAEIVYEFASPQVRNRATVAGNICSGVPCSDFPVILISLDASVELQSGRGSRAVKLVEFFTGPRETVRESDEILTHILIPEKKPGSGVAYLKFQRRASNSLSVASVGACVTLVEGTCSEARIVLGAVAPIPLLAQRASASLTGEAVTSETIARAAAIARDESMPITDVRGSVDFRRDLVQVLTRRALQRAVERSEHHTKRDAK